MLLWPQHDIETIFIFFIVVATWSVFFSPFNSFFFFKNQYNLRSIKDMLRKLGEAVLFALDNYLFKKKIKIK